MRDRACESWVRLADARGLLDEYFSSIRDVEKRLERRKQWTDQPKPDAPFDKPANPLIL